MGFSLVLLVGWIMATSTANGQAACVDDGCQEGVRTNSLLQSKGGKTKLKAVALEDGYVEIQGGSCTSVSSASCQSLADSKGWTFSNMNQGNYPTGCFIAYGNNPHVVFYNAALTSSLDCNGAQTCVCQEPTDVPIYVEVKSGSCASVSSASCAAIALTKRYAFKQMNQGNYPTGCFIAYGNNPHDVFFNAALTSSLDCNGAQTCVCQEPTDAPTDSPTVPSTEAPTDAPTLSEEQKKEQQRQKQEERKQKQEKKRKKQEEKRKKQEEKRKKEEKKREKKEERTKEQQNGDRRGDDVSLDNISRLLDEKISALPDALSRVLDDKLEPIPDALSRLMDDKLEPIPDALSRLIDDKLEPIQSGLDDVNDKVSCLRCTDNETDDSGNDDDDDNDNDEEDPGCKIWCYSKKHNEKDWCRGTDPSQVSLLSASQPANHTPKCSWESCKDCDECRAC